MKAGRTLHEFAVELDRQAKVKRDFIVASGSMQMEVSAELFSLCKPLESGMREVTPFGMTDLFHRQLGASLGIPAKYYDKMRSDYPELLASNVNGWFQHEPSRHTVRTLDAMARAFLSDRYRRIDNYAVANAVLPVISEMPQAFVRSVEITENRLYIKVVNPRLQAEVTPGDVVQSGIVIQNSEVGLGAVSVMPLIYRLVCSNGMIVQDHGQRKYHVGRRADEESWELFSDETLQADDHAFMLKLADVTRTAVDEARFAVVVDKLREAAGVRITGRVPDVVELTAKRYGFSQEEEKGILQCLIEDGNLSLYGLSNAVTRTSQDAANYDRATELEAAGWNIATMPHKDWWEING